VGISCIDGRCLHLSVPCLIENGSAQEDKKNWQKEAHDTSYHDPIREDKIWRRTANVWFKGTYVNVQQAISE